MACKALHLIIIGVGFMQFYTVSLLFFAKTMAVQANSIGYLACLLDFFLMAGIFAACFVGYKLGMVDCYQSSLDGLVRHFVAICTARLYQSFVGLIVPKEMACKTYIVVHIEMFISLKVAVTRATCDSYSIDNFCDVIFVSELDTLVVGICC